MILLGDCTGEKFSYYFFLILQFNVYKTNYILLLFSFLFFVEFRVFIRSYFFEIILMISLGDCTEGNFSYNILLVFELEFNLYKK